MLTGPVFKTLLVHLYTHTFTHPKKEKEEEERGKVANGDEVEKVEKEVEETLGLEKPVQARAANEEGNGNEDAGPNPAQEGFSFSNKRLCERWLDNLFMVLYEASNKSLLCFYKV